MKLTAFRPLTAPRTQAPAAARWRVTPKPVGSAGDVLTVSGKETRALDKLLARAANARSAKAAEKALAQALPMCEGREDLIAFLEAAARFNRHSGVFKLAESAIAKLQPKSETHAELVAFAHAARPFDVILQRPAAAAITQAYKLSETAQEFIDVARFGVLYNNISSRAMASRAIKQAFELATTKAEFQQIAELAPQIEPIWLKGLGEKAQAKADALK